MLVKSKINGHCMGYDLHMDEEVDLPEEVVSALGEDVQAVKSNKKEEVKEVKGAKNTAMTAEDAKTKTLEEETKEEVKEEQNG